MRAALNIREDTGCWEWESARDAKGYGRCRWRGRSGCKAHRVIYESVNGPIVDGLPLDHLCRNPACVNPAHLEPVTHAENMARSAPAVKTHCVNGHEFTPENTYRRPNGWRECRTCVRAATRAQRLGSSRAAELRKLIDASLADFDRERAA